MPPPMAVLQEVGGGLESGQATSDWEGVVVGKGDGGSVGALVGEKVAIRKVNRKPITAS